jgi:hypothetical protein
MFRGVMELRKIRRGSTRWAHRISSQTLLSTDHLTLSSGLREKTDRGCVGYRERTGGDLLCQALVIFRTIERGIGTYRA